jgi:ribonuclease HI
MGNPGPGGYAAVLLCDGRRKELSGGYRRTTNNRMEIMAAIAGLEALKQKCSVKIHTDSLYLQKSISLGWARKWRAKEWKKGDGKRPSWDLWGRLLDLCARHDVEFAWVRGHAGDVENERCDILSVQAANRKDLPADTGYDQASAPASLFD